MDIIHLAIPAAFVFAAILAALMSKGNKDSDPLPDILFIPKSPQRPQEEPVTPVSVGTVPSTVPGTVPAPQEPPAPKPKGIDYGPRAALVKRLIEVESDGIDTAIGDRHLKDMAYGCLQIRKPVCIDVNRAFGLSLTPKMMLGNRQLSIDTFYRYMSLYVTRKRLGREPTDEDRARIWNGGPSAWNPQNRLYTATTGYWGKVRKGL